jgi:hypothetical protein
MFAKGSWRIGAAMTAIAALAGCNGTIHRKSMLGGDEILAVDARQRLTVSGREAMSGRRVICAEPSPDAIVAQAASLASALDSPATPGGNGAIKGALAAGVAESAASIGLRTQSIQLMRDGYYRLCEALLNGQIGPDEYRDVVENIDVFILSMTAVEQLGDKIVAANNVAIGASSNSSANLANPPQSGQNSAFPSPGFGPPSNVTINYGSEAGQAALHKSAAIVEVVRMYLAAKKGRSERSDANKLRLAKLGYTESDIRYLDKYYRVPQPRPVRYHAGIPD